jgi:(E)-4-hydroxy-3-methyl-but-2-enyl pyrophosphate reductase
MKITIAKTAGFCMGVQRAVEMALEAPRKYEKPVFTFGPLIHNPQVISLFKKKGISVMNDIPDRGTGTVLIRAHGVSPGIKEDLQKAGFKVIDATCPRVIKIQTIIKKYTRQGYTAIIIGDKHHPEVLGLFGYAGNKGCIVNNHKDLNALPSFDKAFIVAQTTQNTLFFEDVKQWAGQFPHYKIFDTICDSTANRQAEVKRMAESVDALIVVGGHNSGNTQRLAEIARQTGKPAFHIETESELDNKPLDHIRCIGITAGASTPNWIIKRVYSTLELLSNKNQIWRKLLFSIQRTLLLTEIYVSLGAGCLCYSCIKLQQIESSFQYMLISILYVLSIHLLNNLMGKKSDYYNDPDRMYFYNKHKVFLLLIALNAIIADLVIAYRMGLNSFLVILTMTIFGLLYNLRIVPKRFVGGRYLRISDIPGSKTVLVALAWGIVTSIFPPMSVSGNINLITILVFIWSAGMVFVRTAFFDILYIQEDRIVSKKTIPLLLGEKRTINLIKSILLLIFIILFLSSAFHIIINLGIILAFCPIFMFMIFSAYERGYMASGIRLEFMIETNFILAGIITFFWSLV